MTRKTIERVMFELGMMSVDRYAAIRAAKLAAQAPPITQAQAEQAARLLARSASTPRDDVHPVRVKAA